MHCVHNGAQAVMSGRMALDGHINEHVAKHAITELERLLVHLNLAHVHNTDRILHQLDSTFHIVAQHLAVDTTHAAVHDTFVHQSQSRHVVFEASCDGNKIINFLIFRGIHPTKNDWRSAAS